MSIYSDAAMSSTDHRIAWFSRKVPLSRGKHACGRVPWQPPKQAIDVESDLEARAGAWLIRTPGLLALHSQPFTFTYRDDDGWHRYTPDLLAVFRRRPASLIQYGFDRWTVIEVKPESKVDKMAEALARHHRAIEVQMGFATAILTERHIPARGGVS